MSIPWEIVVLLHSAAAGFAILVGANAVLSRGRIVYQHPVLRWAWTASVAVVIASSFLVQNVADGFTWLHCLAVLNAITLTASVIASIGESRRAHSILMPFSYLLLIWQFVCVNIVVTQRDMSEVDDNAVGFVVWSIAMLIPAVLAIVWGIRLRRCHRSNTDRIVSDRDHTRGADMRRRDGNPVDRVPTETAARYF